jgi:hypothetical protein
MATSTTNEIKISAEIIGQDGIPVSAYYTGTQDLWNMMQKWSLMDHTQRELAVGCSGFSELFTALVPTDFMRKMNNYIEEKEKLSIGDEVTQFGLKGQEYYIVIDATNTGFYKAIGKYGILKFWKLALETKQVTKTGKHYDNIPATYFT